MSALQCQNWHKHRDYQCDRVAGHEGPHTTERRIEWTDEDGYWTTREPDEPEPTLTCLRRWGSCEAEGHAHECGFSRKNHSGPCECHVCLTTPPDGPEPKPDVDLALRSLAGDFLGAWGERIAPPATPATEAPTAPSAPDEGAASPVGPGEAVRPRVGAWAGSENLHLRKYAPGDNAAEVYRSPMHDGWVWAAYHPGLGADTIANGTAPTLDAAKAAADAALEAAGYVLEGGAHVDPGALDAAIAERDAGLVERYEVDLAAARAEVERLKAQVVALSGWRDALIGRVPLGEETGPDPVGEYLDSLRAEVARLKAERDEAREDEASMAATLASVTAEANSAAVARGEVAVLREALARLTEQAESADDAARVVLRCDPGDVAGAALALQRERDLARGEVAGLERALRVLAEVRRG